MHPVLFEFEWLSRTWTIRAYSASYFVAGTVLLILSLLMAPRRGLSRRAALVCLLAAGPSLLLGARLLFSATNRTLYQECPARLVNLTFADFSLFGGLLLAGAVVTVICRARRWNAWAMADVLAPGTAMAIAVVRIGCFLRGCCFGIPSDLPWAVRFPSGSLAHFHQISQNAAAIVLGPRAVHPVQLYEMAAALIAAAIATALIVRKAPAGVPFLAAVALYATCRLLNDSVRPASPTSSAPVWLPYAIDVLLIATSVATAAIRKGIVLRRKGHGEL